MNDPTRAGRRATSLLRAWKLACGRDVEALLEQVADGLGGQFTVHQRECVHCQAAMSEFAAFWGPVREAAAVPVRVPADLTAAVISRIRRLVHDAGYTLQITDGGAIRVAARIVAAVARDSARLVPGVRIALGRSSSGGGLSSLAGESSFGPRRPRAAVGVLGRTAVVDLAVAVSYDRPVQDVARDVQRQVIAALRHSLGLDTVTVNVTIDDVLDDDSSQ